MKILHLTSYQEGGAGIACMRLHCALLEANLDSKLLSVFGKENSKKAVYSLEAGLDKIDFERICKKQKRIRYFQSWRVRVKGRPKELFSFPDSLWQIEDHPLVKEANLIHLHWVAGMIDIKRFFAKIDKPVVWTLHDAWPFTGGFHYESYFNAQPFMPISKALLEVKRQAFDKKDIKIVAPSRYMMNLCRVSQVFSGQEHLTIPNSLSSSIYYKRINRDELRKRLGIEKNEYALFFASAEFDYFRKGADILLNAFSSYKRENVKLFIAGRGNQKLLSDQRIHFTGHINDESHFAELLNACDAVVHTSREDNFPNVILESLFCGTPVLAINEGGVSELINDGENGILCTEDKLKEGFDAILSVNFNKDQIASTAQLKFSSIIQSEQFKRLYTALLKR
jgi:glycosyltransferase involved in cell wall biosynthesis